ncbi:MAG: ornithine cyclodeaminase family protein [Anaerolineaceae bacterium]|nr:ornithine cyclodeaminase family protein [Anaerolineaceae bacterium]MDE0330018.1 ornithine cyclodeaminase family protein [Anaerolineaceae bacterium]
MELLVINAAEVRQLLPMAACMDAMESALKQLGRGEAQNPLRSANWLADNRGILLAMPALTEEAMAIKVITVMPGNHGSPYDSHMGAVILFDSQYGRPLALMDATEITAIRTAAVSGVATRALAREDAGDLAILGTGVQARSHLQAMLEARPLRRVQVWSRGEAHRAAYVQWASDELDVEVESAGSAEYAVKGADLICTTTAATEPVLRGVWLSPGAHINAVGASTATTRELDSQAMAMVSHFVDRRESALDESGDYLIPLNEGAIGDDHIRAELGEVLLGRAPGRSSDDEITLFNSLGLAVEDLASAQLIYREAQRRGQGTNVEFGESAEE